MTDQILRFIKGHEGQRRAENDLESLEYKERNE